MKPHGIRSLGALTAQQVGGILGQIAIKGSPWKSVTSDSHGGLRLNSMHMANINWSRLMPIDDDEPDVWLLAAKNKDATAFGDLFSDSVEWLVVPREALYDLTKQSVDEGFGVLVSWAAWGKPDIEMQEPLGVLPALFVDLGCDDYEPPELDDAIADIRLWVEAVRTRFPHQRVTVEFTGARDIHLILKDRLHNEDPRQIYGTLKGMLVPKTKVFRPRQTSQMHGLVGSLNGYADLEPWRPVVVDAGDLDDAAAIERALVRSWSDSGYWTARKLQKPNEKPTVG